MITRENYLKKVKLFVNLKKQIEAIPNVFNSTSFAVKKKIIRFNTLNNLLKDFDEKQGVRH